MAYTMKHKTLKNEAGEVTGYIITADGTKVGMAAKVEGKFDFTPDYEGEPIKGVKTMRDLKAAVEKAIPEGFVKDNAPVSPEPAKVDKVTISSEQEASERKAIEAAADGESEDIDLD